SDAGSIFPGRALPRLLQPGFWSYLECHLSLAHPALCCACSRLGCRAATQHSGASPPGCNLLQPLSLAANVYRRKQCPLLSLEPACDSCLRGTLLLARGTAPPR